MQNMCKSNKVRGAHLVDCCMKCGIFHITFHFIISSTQKSLQLVKTMYQVRLKRREEMTYEPLKKYYVLVVRYGGDAVLMLIIKQSW
jgi:hypothetical protein